MPLLADKQRPPLPERVANRVNRARSWFSRARFGRPAAVHRFVFIVTYGRTGSTLLQKMIGTLPGHYIAGENYNSLYGIYLSYRSARVLSRKYGPGYQKADHPWHGACAADPERFARQMVDAFVSSILRPPRGARVIGFKEIRYLDILDDLYDYLMFMADFLGPAKFVINTRIVEDVAKSSWWREWDQDRLAADIARFDEITARIVADHPDRFIKIAFEDWTKNPATLRPMFALLGEEFDAAAVDEILGVKLTHSRYSAVS